MKYTVTSIIFLVLLLSPVSALIFSLDSPNQIRIDESFSVSISASTSNNYDVKIFVENAEGDIISRIYNDGWKNPYYYLKSVFPDKSEFDIKIINYSSEATICARLRKSESTSFTEECLGIGIIGQDTEEPEQTEDENQEQEENIIESEKDSGPDFVLQQPEASQSSEQEIEKPERIHLNPQAKESTTKFVTKDEKLRLFALYGFTALVVLIVIFLAFKKL